MKSLLPLLVILSFSLLLFQACQKHSEFEGKYELFHIVELDTLSFVAVPNSFSPDGDGINDVFVPVVNGIDHAQYSFKLYQKGKIIFESQDPNVYWNGEIKGVKAYGYSLHWTLKTTDLYNYQYNMNGLVRVLR